MNIKTRILLAALGYGCSAIAAHAACGVPNQASGITLSDSTCPLQGAFTAAGTLKATPTTVTQGNAATLTYSVGANGTGAISCSLSGSGASGLTGTGTVVVSEGRVGTDTCTLTVDTVSDAITGAASASATVAVTAPLPPTATVSISPANQTLGNPVTVSWALGGSPTAASLVCNGSTLSSSTASGSTMASLSAPGTLTCTETDSNTGGTASGTASAAYSCPSGESWDNSRSTCAPQLVCPPGSTEIWNGSAYVCSCSDTSVHTYTDTQSGSSFVTPADCSTLYVMAGGGGGGSGTNGSTATVHAAGSPGQITETALTSISPGTVWYIYVGAGGGYANGLGGSFGTTTGDAALNGKANAVSESGHGAGASCMSYTKGTCAGGSPAAGGDGGCDTSSGGCGGAGGPGNGGAGALGSVVCSGTTKAPAWNASWQGLTGTSGWAGTPETTGTCGRVMGGTWSDGGAGFVTFRFAN